MAEKWFLAKKKIVPDFDRKKKFSPILAPFLPYAFSAKVSQKSGKKWTFLGKNFQFFFSPKMTEKMIFGQIFFCTGFWPKNFFQPHFGPIPTLCIFSQSQPKIGQKMDFLGIFFSKNFPPKTTEKMFLGQKKIWYRILTEKNFQPHFGPNPTLCIFSQNRPQYAKVAQNFRNRIQNVSDWPKIDPK